MSKRKHKSSSRVKPGMLVKTENGNLGEEDISQPYVHEVVRDEQGNTSKLIVRKGTVFQKQLDVPLDRVQKIVPASRPEDGNPGYVILDIDEREAEALNIRRVEEVMSKQQHRDSLLTEVEKDIPTADGVRAMEVRRHEHSDQDDDHDTQLPSSLWLRILGPGFLAGMAGNDSSAVASYSIDGAQAGFGHLWLLLLSTPLYQVVQYSCARIGRLTQKGLAEVLSEHYGRVSAIVASLTLIIANVALITADLVAIGSGFQLLTNINWIWFIVPIALILWYLTVFSNFEALKRIFIVMGLAFITYIITDIMARPDWGSILSNTFLPHINFTFASSSSAVALLGATISPYNIYWQVHGEKEERRPGNTRQKLLQAFGDIGVGVVSGNLVAYCIIICTATTLFTHHKNITTASDAALALVAIMGPVAKYLFAVGLIGAGLVAIPVLLASTSYAVTGTFGWPSGLSKKTWQSEGFYLILTIALLLSMLLAFCHLDPIQLILWANIISGVLAPVLVVYLLLVGNNRKIMHQYAFGWISNVFLVLTFLIMAVAAVMLFYGLLTGQQ
ncbi:hypothetical protein KDH_28880 [Dictyobacter sp. S3.2.2.5]|uniref:Iron transporter n=1 Tax=Dictyobacter halimunensis TaxID=3026934 RepID=A0ABQ6FP44_9CHLR|nr:hypothetical protein KDH_28880 [Dictyobacter sp. S3.2.2.5]